MGFKDITPTKHTFDKKGEVLTGRILSVGRAEALDVNTYSMLCEDGKGNETPISFLGTTVLDKVLGDKEGQIVRLTYLGEEMSASKRKVKQFKIEVYEADPEPEDTAAAKVAAQGKK